MTAATLTRLEQRIVQARAGQLAARMDWARSPNAETIAAEKAASRHLDELLDLLPRP